MSTKYEVMKFNIATELEDRMSCFSVTVNFVHKFCDPVTLIVDRSTSKIAC